MSQDLTQDELLELAELLTISQRARARTALCIKIGIEYHRELPFLDEPLDSNFAIYLINYLNEIGNTKAICQLCCKELSSIFTGNRESFLKEIAVKLNCSSFFTKDFSSVSPKYSPLNELLKAKKWQEADEVTSTIMRVNFGKGKHDSLLKSDIEASSCTDLNNIEQLWSKYSDKRFGFRKQEQILGKLALTQTKKQQQEDYAFKEFINQIGWHRKVISEQNYSDGHFPAIGTWWPSYEPGWLEALFIRVDFCQAYTPRSVE